MIKAENLVKKFDDFVALDNVNCEIPRGCIYGMVGSNGAGKSTFLRVLAGIYRKDGGNITIDGEDVYENPAVKSKIVFVPDELYLFGGSNIMRMKQLYKRIYPNFDESRFTMLLDTFKLPKNKAINTFSKGMKRQAATILALSAKPEFLLFDETFDGLDPVMRNFVKSLICNDVVERNVTAIITSHSLRELEDTCDQLVLLHKGGVVLESDVQNLKTSLFKVQVAFSTDFDISLFEEIEIREYNKNGSVANLIVNGDRDEVVAKLSSLNPVLLDVLPLTLEEVFTHRMQAMGYDFKDILEEIGNE
ncbi:MAG: ABC transporter ATP-binding protein [Clostridia bacterium]|nr:ABC transporter ATP-binding protein [Clostridia bacterium]MEE1024328.1 ABC transporter ATP-binding protein [Acutalibacteraceae bacterium]